MICPILIGRDAEVGSLDALLDQARLGQGQVVLICGEAGIGKSRLVATMKAAARSAGMPVIEGRCFEYDQGVPYALLISMLRASFIGAADLARPLGPLAPELLPLLPELTLPHERADREPAVDPEQRKRRLFQALAQQVLQSLEPGQAPLLLVFEDLHWSDDTSLEWLLFLARQLEARPVLLLLTFRDDESNPSLRQTLASFDRLAYVTELALERLSQTDMALMLQAIFNLTSPARADFLEALHALTEGNPLFIEEVLKSLIASGDIYQVSGEWTRKPLTQLRIPRTVQVAVQQRTEQLSAGALELLTLAAVAGQRFDLRVLQAIIGQPEAELLRQLRELRAAQLVSEESDETFVFRHALTREAIYGDLLVRERRVRHRAIAEALARGVAGTPELRAGELALHYEEAALWEPAMSWAQRAGAQAQTLYAYTEALSHLERARRCAQALAMPELVVQADRAIGAAHFRSGQFVEAIPFFERALAATSDPARRAALKADLGGSYANIGDERGLAYLLEALDELDPATQPKEVASAALWAGFYHHLSAQYDRALSYLERAGKLLEGLDDPASLHFYYGYMAIVLMYAGRFEESMIWSRRDIALGETRGDIPAVVLGYLYLAECSEYLGRWDDTVRYAEQGQSFAHQSAWSSFAVWNELEHLVVLYYRGQLDAGRQLALGALERARALNERRAVLHIEKLLVQIEAARGDEEAALRIGATSLRAVDEVVGVGIRSWIRIALAQVHMQREEWELALVLLEQCAALLAGTDNRVIRMELGAPLAETYRALGRLEDAEHLLAETLALTERAGARQYEMAARRMHGRLLLTKGLPLDAIAALDGAVALGEDLGSELELAHALLDQSAARRAAGEAAEAHADCARACELTERLGARALLWQAHATLGQLATEAGRKQEAAREYAAARTIVAELCAAMADERPREQLRRRAAQLIPPEPSRRAVRASFDGLTPREREVVALIARGCSNREIAEALMLSERTITTHISSIFAKLGFTARTQVAAWAVEKGLT